MIILIEACNINEKSHYLQVLKLLPIIYELSFGRSLDGFYIDWLIFYPFGEKKYKRNYNNLI